MKIIVIVLLFFGIGNLIPVIPAFGGNLPIVERIVAAIVGSLALTIVWGLLRKKYFTWYLGFVLIVLGSIYFIISVIPFALDESVVERTIILISCTVGGVLAAVFWSVYWYRQCWRFISA